jgi:hypothetical protein
MTLRSVSGDGAVPDRETAERLVREGITRAGFLR